MSYCLEGDVVKYSYNYGGITTESKLFDDSKDLGGEEDSFIQYLIKKIKIYSGIKNNKEVIGGVQLTYINLKTKEIKELPLRKGDIEYEDEDITTFELLPNEYLINLFIRFTDDADYIYQLGFETNKKRKILKGSENGSCKKVYSNGGENIIIGTFGNFNKKLDSFGILYANLKDYMKKFYLIYFQLKFKIKKDEKFRKENEEKYNSFSNSDKYLFKACLLPDSAFNEIMKFCMF